MYISELPEGSVISINGTEFELTKDWRFSDSDDVMTKEQASAYQDQDVKIISVPYEVTLKLAKWLEGSYRPRVNRVTPESLIIKAAEEVAEDKRDAHISNLPKKLGGKVTITVKTRDEVSDVLDSFERVLDNYNAVTIADVYDLVGITCRFTDQQWGWTGEVMSRIVVIPHVDGYDVVFPNTERL